MTSKLTRERIQRIIRAIDSEAYDEEEIREWLSSDEIMELSRMALAAMDSEPVARILRHGPAFKGLCDFTQARTYEELPMSAVAESNGYWLEGQPLYLHAQPAPVSITEAQVAALEEEEKSFHDAIRKCIASLRYHHKRSEAHSTGYKGSTLEDDTLKSINFLKRNITAAMLSGGKS